MNFADWKQLPYIFPSLFEVDLTRIGNVTSFVCVLLVKCDNFSPSLWFHRAHVVETLTQIHYAQLPVRIKRCSGFSCCYTIYIVDCRHVDWKSHDCCIQFYSILLATAQYFVGVLCIEDGIQHFNNFPAFDRTVWAIHGCFICFDLQ